MPEHEKNPSVAGNMMLLRGIIVRNVMNHYNIRLNL